MFSFDHADEYQEVSIGSVDKETKANKKQASKRDIIVVDDKDLLARNSERIPKNTKKVNFWCLNVWNEWATQRNALKLSLCFVCQYVKWEACGCVRGENYCNIHEL